MVTNNRPVAFQRMRPALRFRCPSPIDQSSWHRRHGTKPQLRRQRQLFGKQAVREFKGGFEIAFNVEIVINKRFANSTVRLAIETTGVETRGS